MGVVTAGTTRPTSADELSPEEKQITGAALLGGGGLLLTVGVIDLIRAAGTFTDTERVDQDGRVLRSGLPCPGATAPDQRITAEGPGGEILLGVTGPDGTASVDLVSVIPRRLVVGPDRRSSLELQVAGRPQAAVGLGPVQAVVEERTWAGLDPERCAADPVQNRSHCQSLSSYLSDFPHGPHAAEARATLDRVAEALRAHEEAERQRAEEARRRAEEEARRRAEEEERRRAV